MTVQYGQDLAIVMCLTTIRCVEDKFMDNGCPFCCWMAFKGKM